MSFLSYLSHPSLVVASVGGVSLGVTSLLLPWKTTTSRSFLSNSFFMNQSNTYGRNKQFEKSGTCNVIKGFQDVINKISSSLDHVAISCKNELNDDILEDSWVALFPLSLFKNEWKGELDISENKNFSIKTVTTEEEGNILRWDSNVFRTKFMSDKFLKGEIIGIWEYDDWDVLRNNKTVDIVTLEGESKKIYFVHKYER